MLLSSILPSHTPVPSPPSDVSMSQNGLNSLLVTWTPSQGPYVTGYTIYYQQQDGGHSGSVEAGQYDTSITKPGLIVGATYSISIAANSSTLPSTVTTGPSATIGMHYAHISPNPLTMHYSIDLNTLCAHFLISQIQPPSLCLPPLLLSWLETLSLSFAPSLYPVE